MYYCFLRINRTKKIFPMIPAKKKPAKHVELASRSRTKNEIAFGPVIRSCYTLAFDTRGEGRMKGRVGWQRDTHGNLNCIRAWRERKTHIAPVIVQIPFSIFRAFILLIFLMRPHVFRFPWALLPAPNFHPLSVTRARTRLQFFIIPLIFF